MFTHLVVPIADSPDTAAAVFPAAAMARAFDATVVVVAHPSGGTDPESIIDQAGTAELAAVRLDVDTELGAALDRLAPAFAAAAVVCTAALAPSLLESWSGPLLVFGGGSDPSSYSVGGTIIVDAALHTKGERELFELGRAFGFDFEPVDDVTTASGHSGQVIVPRRRRTAEVIDLIERWPGPVYLLGV
ncbi:MAG: hypothetical protein ACR2QE_07555 [Acidimicrobiales bacterium]